MNSMSDVEKYLKRLELSNILREPVIRTVEIHYNFLTVARGWMRDAELVCIL